MLYDEIDTVFGPKARENEELRGLLNAGYRKGAVAGRCAMRGNSVETEEIQAYSAVAIAGLGWLPDTILSRSIIVRMRPRHAGETVEPFRRRLHEPEGHAIRERLASWARSTTVAWPSLPDEIQDRNADIWEPLIAIADAVGGHWPLKARVAAVALVLESREAEASLGVRLLADLQTIFRDHQELPSKTILERLIELPESPWGDLHGKPLDDRGLAKRLKAYGVKPKTIRTSTGTPRGYCRSDLEDQWLRYLPSPGESKTTKTTKTSETSLQIKANKVAAVADVLPVGEGGEACEHCHKPGDVMECHYGDTSAWLHRECVEPWRLATEDLSIPGFLDRRSELVGQVKAPARGSC